MANNYSDFSVSEDRVRICGWPTDTLIINHDAKSDYLASSPENKATPHTVLLFIPGNPGVIHWYTDSLVQIITRLGRGYAARGVSYAGHGVGEDVVGTKDDHDQSFHCEELKNKRSIAAAGEKYQQNNKDMTIPWTMDGQVKHKIEWLEKVLEDWQKQYESTPNLIFISHSIGAHFIQCMLLRRPDILAKTRHILHLMPFFRFDPPPLQRLFLSTAAQSYKFTIPIVTSAVRALSSTLPRGWIDVYLEKVVGLDCTKGRQIALDIFMHPNMVKNHLVLGMQELRELPEHPNDVALRLIGTSPTSILFCGCPDQWAPIFHMEDLRRMQRGSMIPDNIYTEYIEELRHDFVVHPEQIDPVVNFCVARIQSVGDTSVLNIRSRL